MVWIGVWDDYRTYIHIEGLSYRHLRSDSAGAGGYAGHSSFCSIVFGMAMFRDAHHYYFFLNKNVEEYQSLATELGDCEFLTDSEAYTGILAVLKTDYNGTAMKDLTKAQKFDLARKLRHDFRSSNGQIRRVLGLSQYEVDSLFPLSATPKG